MITRIEVDRVDGRHLARLGYGPLRPQVVASGPDRCRIGLLASTALLLGGDVVELAVRVGPGASLDLFDVAGTVAYHGRGHAAAWRVHLEVGPGARLTYVGEPFVVADGADVTRILTVDLAADAAATIRDTIVLGRFGELGGPLRSSTTVRREGRPVVAEDQRFDPARLRTAPGLLGSHRVVDTVLQLGTAVTEPPTDAVTYALVDGAGRLARWLGETLADSPLNSLDLTGRPPVTPQVAF